MSYKKLRIWILARELVIDIHTMTINELPKHEMYETGSQIRRSMTSVKANIVEGYGRRSYKNDYLRFLVFAEASLFETIDHLESLYETGSLKSTDFYDTTHGKLESLGKMLHVFIEKVKLIHKTNTY